MAAGAEKINSGHFKELEKELDACPECGARLVHDHHKLETSCSKCFLVISESQFYEKDSGMHTQKDGKNDTSHDFPSDKMRTDKGRGTMISGNRDAYGKRIDVYTTRKLNRINNRAKISRGSDKNIMIARSKIKTIVDQMQLPPYIADESSIVYKNAARKNLIRGRTVDAIVAASIYSTCKEKGIPLDIKMLSDRSGVDRRVLIHSSLVLKRKIGIGKSNIPVEARIISTCSALKYSMDVERKAKELYKQFEPYSSGISPTVLSATLSYVAGLLLDERRVQRYVTAATGITEHSLRDNTRIITTKLNLKI